MFAPGTFISNSENTEYYSVLKNYYCDFLDLDIREGVQNKH